MIPLNVTYHSINMKLTFNFKDIAYQIESLSSILFRLTCEQFYYLLLNREKIGNEQLY